MLGICTTFQLIPVVMSGVHGVILCDKVGQIVFSTRGRVDTVVQHLPQVLMRPE